MKMGFELNLTQTQKLIMTPELRQAIQVLQFNNVELMEFINKQLEVNPFLEPIDKNSEAISKEEQSIDLIKSEKSDSKDEID